jgi:uncharacterized protein (DUF2249 family)
MHIDENTKISKIINDTPAAIDAIVSISKHFEKLRIPILRKTLASRLTIKQAARIGGVSVTDFFEKLQHLGFSYNSNETASHEEKNKNAYVKKLNFEKTIDLDVRGILKQNKDPFNDIMGALETLPLDHALNIINTFEPTPLINILSKKGYIHETVFVEKMLVYTYFKKESPNNDSINISLNESRDSQSLELLAKYIDKIITIDVRELEMPLPMSTILNALNTLPINHLLFVHHKKVPKFLFPELAERSFKWHIQEIKEGDVKLFIFK